MLGLPCAFLHGLCAKRSTAAFENSKKAKWSVAEFSRSSVLVSAEVRGLPAHKCVACNLGPFDLEVGVPMLKWFILMHRTKSFKA